VERLKKLAAKADMIYLAPDPDREGEAIAAHLSMQLLPMVKDKSKVRRVTFNEITKKAVQAAFLSTLVTLMEKPGGRAADAAGSGPAGGVSGFSAAVG